MYNAEILADSLSPQGDRITTMKITFPRIVLSEFNTHRMFSRNSASSRAIPFNKMLQMVEANPFIPIAWQSKHTGMQGTYYLNGDSEQQLLINKWLEARDLAIQQSKLLNNNNVTKQLCNRLLEPFMWHTVIVTATEWNNFFELRCPQYIDAGGNIHRSKKDYCQNFIDESWRTEIQWLQINKSQADIHIQAIAELMWDAYNESKPKKQLKVGEWHIPFGDNILDDDLDELFKVTKNLKNELSINNEEEQNKFWKKQDKILEELRTKIATARCARISYETLGDNPKIDYEADIKLHDMLMSSSHWSPFEHCARAMSYKEYNSYFNGKSNENWDTDLVTDNTYEVSAQFDRRTFGWCRNFRGFIQYRHLVEKGGNNGR